MSYYTCKALKIVPVTWCPVKRITPTPTPPPPTIIITPSDSILLVNPQGKWQENSGIYVSLDISF